MVTNPLALTPELQQSFVKLLDAGNNYQDSISYLAEALKLSSFQHDTRSSILLDYASWLCTLCHRLQLDARQATAVINIGQELLRGCAAGAPIGQAQAQLKTLLLQLCSPEPQAKEAAGAPVAAAQASPEEATQLENSVQLPPDVITRLASSFTSTLLQHYNLWAYVFTHEQQHVQHQHQLMIETPVPPLPLQQALIEADWSAHLAAEQAHREAQEAVAAAAEQEACAAAAAAAAEAAEAEEAAARAEQLNRKPKTLDEAVDKLVALKLEDLRQSVAADLTAKAAALTAVVGQLEQQLAQQAALAPAPAAAPRPSSHGGKSRVVSAKSVVG